MQQAAPIEAKPPMYHLATRVVAGTDVSPVAIAVILSRGWKEEEGRGEEGRGEEVGEDDGGGGRDEMVTVVDSLD